MSREFKIYDINEGHCQVTYATRNDEGQRIYYCLQNDFGDHVKFFRCTQEGEPQSECTIKAKIKMEVPTGDSKLEKLCRRYIAENDLIE